MRVPLVGDSAACGGAFARWRSPSQRLNHLLRINTLHVLGLYPGHSWVRSKCSPPDDPTRDVPLRAASCCDHGLEELGPLGRVTGLCAEADAAAAEPGAT